MQRSFYLLPLLSLIHVSFVRAQESKVIETSVCEILKKPHRYNGRLVKLRGRVRVSSEYSTMTGERMCSDAIWFSLGIGVAPPGLIATVQGPGSLGTNSEKGKTLQIQLIEDSNYEQLLKYLELSAKGEACLDSPRGDSIPDCRTYRITATITGRIDSVSKAVHEAHLKRSPFKSPDGKGFGHMGLLDAQIVVQSVEHVVVVDSSEPIQSQEAIQ